MAARGACGLLWSLVLVPIVFDIVKTDGRTQSVRITMMTRFRFMMPKIMIPSLKKAARRACGLQVCLLLLCSAFLNSEEPEFNPKKIVRPFPPIKNAKFLKGTEVKDEVTASELVIGVVVKGQARAYPINMLTGPKREIINEVIDGYHFAATW